MNEEQVLLALIASNGLLFLVVIYLFIRVSSFMKDGNGKSLESNIISILETHRHHEHTFGQLMGRIASLEERARKAISHVRTLRYDPFGGTGDGKQSFTVALIDDDGNGTVISSISGRESVRVFAKPISQFASIHELSDEEKRAITHQ